MTEARSNPQQALDAFFDVIRRRVGDDPTFAAELISALNVPVELQIQTSADVGANMTFLDPFVIAGKGVDDFRQTFGPLKDADLRRIIRAFNLASPDSLTGKGAPKGAALVTLMWEAASAQRKRWDERK
jgi:hypothetical protein